MTSKPEEKDYYELLGVTRNASTEEIKLAFREIARVYHPDSKFYSEIIDAPLTERDQNIFKLVTAAYDTLIDPEKRAEYDRRLVRGLHEWDNSPLRPPRMAPSWEEGRDQHMQRAVHHRGFGVSAREEYVSVSTAQQTRPLAELLRSTKRTFADHLLLFIGLGLPLLTLAGAAIYIYWYAKK